MLDCFSLGWFNVKRKKIFQTFMCVVKSNFFSELKEFLLRLNLHKK
jgi:hypothetical protein